MRCLEAVGFGEGGYDCFNIRAHSSRTNCDCCGNSALRRECALLQTSKRISMRAEQTGWMEWKCRRASPPACKQENFNVRQTNWLKCRRASGSGLQAAAAARESRP